MNEVMLKDYSMLWRPSSTLQSSEQRLFCSKYLYSAGWQPSKSLHSSSSSYQPCTNCSSCYCCYVWSYSLHILFNLAKAKAPSANSFNGSRSSSASSPPLDLSAAAAILEPFSDERPVICLSLSSVKLDLLPSSTTSLQ